MQQSLFDFFSSLGVRLSADALLVVVALTVAVLTSSVWRALMQRQLTAQRVRHHAELNAQQQRADDQTDQLGHTFSALSHRALQQNNEAFLTLAKSSFEQLHGASASDLDARQQSFANLVKPIEQSLRATESQLQQLDISRRVSEAKLTEQIGGLLKTQHHLHAEAKNLSNALRRPEIRGQWGELTLHRLVELAGMSEHCDFTEQASIDAEAGKIRPDMIIHLPNQRHLIVDVKTPLDAYMSASESTDHREQAKHLAKHAKNVKLRITELASKQYWQQFEQSPDFVILFIPGDQFLSSALQEESSLLEFALEKRVLLATPTSLVGLLRAIAYGWSQDSLSQNTEQLKAVGQTLARRLHTLTEHLNKLGINLDQTIGQFNRVVGSFQQNTVPAARRLAELGLDVRSEPPTEPQPSSGQPAKQLLNTMEHKDDE